MKQLLTIILSITLTSIIYSQQLNGVQVACGSEININLKNGDNLLCTITNSGIKLKAEVNKGKITEFYVVLEDNSLKGLKQITIASKKKNPTGNNKPNNIETIEICRPFCITVNGKEYCFDGCLAKY